VSVTKKDAAQSSQSVATFHLVRNSRQTIHSLLQRFPLTTKERQELQQRLERNQYNEGLPACLLLTNNYINMQRLVCHVSVMKERMWLSPASNASLYFLFAFCDEFVVFCSDTSSLVCFSVAVAVDDKCSHMLVGTGINGNDIPWLRGQLVDEQRMR